jgi:V8-like Glu-specific endopeptidase
MSLRVAAAAAAVSLGIAACGSVQTAEAVLGSQCGPTLDFTPINQYHGAIATVQDREDAVVLIDGDCTGTLIAAQTGPVVLTAGHCVVLHGRSLVAFNVEDNPDGDQLVTNGTVIEQATEPDYALIKLDALPQVTPTPLTSRPTDRVAVIQHPRSRPKVIAEGSLAGACNDQVYYSDLDTLVGSSGAGVLTSNGYLVAVHTDGDCAADGGGDNRGARPAASVAATG